MIWQASILLPLLLRVCFWGFFESFIANKGKKGVSTLREKRWRCPQISYYLGEGRWTFLERPLKNLLRHSIHL